MTQLTPHLAAAAANAAYTMLTPGNLNMGAFPYVGTIDAAFPMAGSNRLSGVSGNMFRRIGSGFGYCAMGKSGSTWDGHLLIATRGTQTTEDWLSNFNFSAEPGPGGFPVHTGFHKIYKSMQPELIDAITDLKRNNTINHVHCVGHSLGGALATLNAAWASSQRMGQVSCYTFGAPRVGSLPFALWLQSRLGSENLRRVYHPADPVPMIPLFPFFHAPTSSGIALVNSDGALVDKSFHNRTDVYLEESKKFGSWAGMAHAGVQPDSGLKIQQWLAQGGVTNGFVMGSARLLGLIGDALAWIVQQAIKAGVGVVAFTGATLLDQIASIIHAGARVSITLYGYAETLVKMIFRFLGRVRRAAADLTMDFLRWVLGLLFGVLANTARRALDMLP
ncbi:lipase family protein [Sandarakinorhabdus sp.]|uniref:lipase family protein n=1 Tax=Sandarakinorhabdus sp. TaxID=1916663 RepID=UPI00286DC59C|nr:lipase family protein [Sandarakinorhabdus sp.]